MVVSHISQEEGTQQSGPCGETPAGDSGWEAEGTRRKQRPAAATNNGLLYPTLAKAFFFFFLLEAFASPKS